MVGTILQNAISSKNTKELLTKIEVKKYKETFPEILDKLVKLSENTYSGSSDMSQMTDWMTKVIQYNVLSDQLTNFGGILVAAAYKSITKNETSTENLKQAYLLGWGWELCDSSRRMGENLIDNINSIEEDGGKPAWHTIQNVGMTAINDHIILKLAGYNNLKIFFGDKPFYHQLLDTARVANQMTILGRALWEEMEKEADISKIYTVKKYKQVTSFMMSYYSFYQPVESALIMAGRDLEKEPELKRILKELLLQIGYYYQLMRDYENIFGKRMHWTENASGKMRRLTWFFVKALEIGSEQQISQLIQLVNDENVDNKVQAGENLRNFYKSLQLLERFDQEKNDIFDDINEKIANLSKYEKNLVDFCHYVLKNIEN